MFELRKMLYLLLAATADVVIEFHIIYDSLIIQNGQYFLVYRTA